MCEPISATTAITLAVSAAAAAASSYAASEAAKQQDSANANSIRQRQQAEEANAIRAREQRNRLNDEAMRTQRELEDRKTALFQQHQAETDPTQNAQAVEEESQRLSQRLTPSQIGETPTSSAVGGEAGDIGVRVVQDALAQSRDSAKNNFQLPLSQALAAQLARGNVSLGNQLSMKNMGDQFGSLNNQYGGTLGAIGFGSSMNDALFGLGNNMANTNYTLAQSKLPYVGQGWRDAAGAASAVSSLASSYGASSMYGGGGSITGHGGKQFAPKTSSTGGTFYAPVSGKL